MNLITRILFFLAFIPGLALAQTKDLTLDQLVKQKPETKLVHDYSGVLSPAQKDYLDKKLVTYDDSTSTQIAIVLVKKLGSNYSIEEAAVQMFRNWGIGSKKDNNGVLILAAIEDRKIKIEVGYGLEAEVTDYTSGQIIDSDIKPNFKAGNYYEGLDKATNSIIAAAAGKYKAPSGYNKRGKSGGSFIRLMVMIFIIFIILAVISKKGDGNGGMMSRRGYRDWTPPIIGNWGGGGSSGGGGGWSGGFGGFGGGSSGGGGASGDW